MMISKVRLRNEIQPLLAYTLAVDDCLHRESREYRPSDVQVSLPLMDPMIFLILMTTLQFQNNIQPDRDITKERSKARRDSNRER